MRRDGDDSSTTGQPPTTDLDDDAFATRQIESQSELRDEPATSIITSSGSTSAASVESSDELLKRRLLSGTGANVGHFVVQGYLDEGGMALIFEALDEELDRPVALKILRSQKNRDSSSQERLVREAQALAKLSHPNVVTVYEVGEWENHVYIAMELIQGTSLRTWLKLKPRGWPEVVEVLLQAGRGLAAAHRAGIIHRDFKPANVLVGADGRVRVLDFGLAFAPLHVESDIVSALEELESSTNMPSSNLLSETLTVAGAIAGTPAYMAPEQFVGGQILDAQADQYAFCLSLYESLYHKRPYKSLTFKERVVELATNPVVVLPKTPHIPNHIRRVLRRGLNADPASRYPSMDALLTALADDPTRRRRWLAGGTLAGLALLAGGYELAHQEAASYDPCAALSDDLEVLWNDRREALASAIRESGQSYASVTWERLQPILTDYASRWGEERVAACRAHQSQAYDAALYGAATGCLQQRKMAFESFLAAVEETDSAALAKVIQAANALPLLDRCSDVESLAAATPPPEDPAIAEEVEHLREIHARAAVESELARVEPGLALSVPLVERAEELGYRPLEAKALAVHGKLLLRKGDFEEAEKVLTKAMWRAELIRDDDLIADVMNPLLFCIGEARGDYERAMAMRDHADVVIERLGGETRGEALILAMFGIFAHRKGDPAKGIELLDRALRINEKLYGIYDSRTTVNLINLSSAYVAAGNSEKAQECLEKALKAQEESLGLEHPNLSQTLTNLGVVAMQETRHEESLRYFVRAKEITEATFGPDYPELGILLSNIGSVNIELERYAEARASLERALEIHEATRGPDHLLLIYPLANLSAVTLELGEYETSKAYADRALLICRAKLDANATLLAMILHTRGAAYSEQDEHSEALSNLHEAENILLSKELENTTEDLAVTRYYLAKAYLDSKSAEDQERGRAYTERSIAGFQELGHDHYDKRIKTLQGWLER